MNDPARPTSAGEYELLLDLASGGMGTVYLGKSPRSPLVAIKRPHPHLVRDEVFLAMLHDEARLASAISHPNVVKVRELGFEGQLPFVVMDYIEGISLSELRNALVKAGVAVDPRIALRITLDALLGLHAAHTLTDEKGESLGIIHRDVSPHNILVGTDGVARLTDFGVAKANDRVQTTRVDEVKGKLAYLAPERVDDRRMCTIQSDVFSMAVVLWECLAGRRLFRGEEAVHTIQEVLTLPIPSLVQMGVRISPALDRVIARGLERDLSARWKDAHEFRDALTESLSEADVASTNEVADLVERVFGARIRSIHARLRLLGDAEYDRLIHATGLSPRDASSHDAALPTTPLGPALLSQRYAIGQPLPVPAPGVSVPPSRASSFATIQGWLGGAGAAAVVLILVLGACGRSRKASDPTVAVSDSSVAVSITLPYFATAAAIDGTTHELAPASDTLVIRRNGDAKDSARIELTLLDGTRARGTVNVRDGKGFVDPATLEVDSLAEADGLEILPPESADPVAAPAVKASPKGKRPLKRGR